MRNALWCDGRVKLFKLKRELINEIITKYGEATIKWVCETMRMRVTQLRESLDVCGEASRRRGEAHKRYTRLNNILPLRITTQYLLLITGSPDHICNTWCHFGLHSFLELLPKLEAVQHRARMLMSSPCNKSYEEKLAEFCISCILWAIPSLWKASRVFDTIPGICKRRGNNNNEDIFIGSLSLIQKYSEMKHRCGKDQK